MSLLLSGGEIREHDYASTDEHAAVAAPLPCS